MSIWSPTPAACARPADRQAGLPDPALERLLRRWLGCGLLAVCLVPVVYLILMGIVNARRRRVFKNVLAPRLVQEAGPPPEHWGPVRPAVKEGALA